MSKRRGSMRDSFRGNVGADPIEDRINAIEQGMAQPLVAHPSGGAVEDNAATGPATNVAPSRVGKRKATIHMSKAAHMELSLFVRRRDCSLEKFIREAINSHLLTLGAKDEDGSLLQIK